MTVVTVSHEPTHFKNVQLKKPGELLGVASFFGSDLPICP